MRRSANLCSSLDSSSSQDALDSAVVTDELRSKPSDKTQTGVMSSDYDLVRSFDVPMYALQILKAVSLAAALSTACGSYSYLEHMCWLWAALYMILVRSELNNQPVTETKGSLWKDAGKSKQFGIRLVDPATGQLLVDSFSETGGRLKGLLGRIYGKERRDQALRCAQRDAEAYRTLPPRLADISQAMTTHYDELRLFITLACEKLREKEVCPASLCLRLRLTP